MRDFRDRLRTSKVVQWALAYLAIAWLVIEATDLFAGQFGWPAFVPRAVTVLLAVGFLAALVLAWYHGEKGEQRVTTVELLMLAGIFVVAAAAVAMVGGGLVPSSAPESAAAADGRLRLAAAGPPSVAVLPFTNTSGDAENEGFTAGMHDDLLTHLSKIGSLKVISRTSVMEYRDTRKNIREIAAELGVSTVLEGGVQRAGDRVRINVQLIDALTDEHLWAEIYDRELSVENIFAIQTEIAKAIAAALRTTLSPAVEERLAALPTSNLEAYEFFQSGLEYQRRGYAESDMEAAIRMFERAVALDPEFAAAYAALGETHARVFWFHHDRSEDRLRSARAAIDRALAIDSDLPEAHLALGAYYYWGHLAYDDALAELDIAAAGLPGNDRVLFYSAAVYRRQGRMDDAIENFERAIELSPRDAVNIFNLAETYVLVRDFPRALQLFDRAIDLSPTFNAPHTFKARTLAWALGDAAAARAVLAQFAGRRREVLWAAVEVELADGDFEGALALGAEIPEDGFGDQWRVAPRPLILAEIHAARGDALAAHREFEGARIALEQSVAENPSDPRLYSALGRALAGLGRKDEAIRAGERGVELMPMTMEAYRGAYRLLDLARIYATVGEPDAAVELLEQLLAEPSPVSRNELRLDRRWDPIRERPGFARLLSGVAANSS